MTISWKEIRRGIKYPILVFLIKVFVLLIRFLPHRWILKATQRMGGFAFRLVKSERNRTIKNLAIIYGNHKTEKEIYQMAREVFQHQGMNFGEYVRTLHYTTREDFAKVVDIEGEENLKEAYDKNKGVLCLMSHAGSWEYSAILPPVMGYNTTALSRPMPNPRIDKLIVQARQKRGMKNIGRGKAYPQLIEALKNGECLIIMIDQDTTVPGVFVDFLGKSAYTPVGAARLALETKSPVVPMFMVRQPNNRHLFKILPALELIETGDYEKDLLENTRLYAKIISDFIKENPTQWVWMHERWKTTPKDVEEFLEKKRIHKMKNQS